jgi:hypothetical protein
MRVKTGDRFCLEGRAKVDAIDDLLFHDYYTRTPQIRLTDDAASEAAIEVLLDGVDVARLVECAVRHPSLNMRHAVLTSIWNHPDSFREILRFGLQAPEAFAEIRKIVGEELGKTSPADARPTQPAGATLLPKLPLPVHLRGRKK